MSGKMRSKMLKLNRSHYNQRKHSENRERAKRPEKSKLYTLIQALWQNRNDMDNAWELMKSIYQASNHGRDLEADINLQAYEIYVQSRKHDFTDIQAYKHAMDHRRALEQYYKSRAKSS